MSQRDVVLVVENVEHEREQVCAVVQKAGARAVAASNSEDAFEALEKLQPLMVLIELNLPGQQGDACAARIKANRYLADVPIVMATEPSVERVRRAFLAGADDFLPKPLNAHQLAAKIAAAQAAQRRPASLSRPEARKTIAVADDDQFFREMVCHALLRAGYRPIACKSALELTQALAFEDPPPDLCVLDLDGVEIPGGHLVEQITGQPRTKGIPILGLRRGKGPLAELAGVDGPHAKPAITVAGVVARVNDLLFKGTNGRVAARVPFFAVCEFRRRPNEDWVSGFAENISASGLGVRTLTPAAAGAEVPVRISTGDGGPVELTATVAWANEFNPQDAFCFPYGMGLRFSSLPESTKQQIDAVVSSGGHPESA